MKRIAAVFAMTIAASALTIVPAQAAPSLCVSFDITVNGEQQAQNICLPG